jgi:hypothetical protein
MFTITSNVKFENCKSLKRVKFIVVENIHIGEFMEKLNKCGG